MVGYGLVLTTTDPISTLPTEISLLETREVAVVGIPVAVFLVVYFERADSGCGR